MVAERGVDHFLALAIALRQLGADGGVPSLHLVVGGLADVVKQAAAAAEGAVESDFFGEKARQEGDFERMLEHVLRVARAELESAEVVEQLLVQARDVRLLGGGGSELADVPLHFFLGLANELLDAGRVDAAILDQLFERELGNLAPDVVEARDDDDAGCVVHDHIDARRLLERADVSTFAADDSALHVVSRDVDRADGRLRGMAGGVSLDGRRENLARFLLRSLA